MKRARLLVLVVSTGAAIVVTPSPAQAGVPGSCAALAVTTSTSSPLAFSAVLASGPTDGGTLRCSVQPVQFGWYTPHSLPDYASATATNTGVVVLHPTAVSFSLNALDNLAVCTEWTDQSGRTWYWNYSSFSWSPSSEVNCKQLMWTWSDDWVTFVNEFAFSAKRAADSVLCAHIPFVLTGSVLGGTVTVTPTGDVLVNGNPVYDCGGTTMASPGASTALYVGVP